MDSILSEGLTDPQLIYAMGMAAENVAARWNVTRAKSRIVFPSKVNVGQLPRKQRAPSQKS